MSEKLYIDSYLQSSLDGLGLLSQSLPRDIRYNKEFN